MKVLLVEDHPLMVAGLTSRLEGSAGMEVCAVASNSAQLSALYPGSSADVVLCDVRLSAGESGVDACRTLLQSHPHAVVLMYSASTNPMVAQTCVDAGAVGFILKSTSVPNLIECIEAAAAGEHDIFDRVTGAALVRIARRGIAPVDGRLAALTLRQRELLTVMAETGVTSTEDLADRLFIAKATVRTHMTRLFQILGVQSRGAAIQIAFDTGLVTPSHTPLQRVAN